MKIINIGSLNIDRIYGVEHFVQPGETIKVRTYSEACGGKGLNQSIAAARSGAEVHHAGAVGSDGGMLLEILRISGVHTGKTKILSGASGHAVIQVDKNGQNNIIICGGANDAVSMGMIDDALREISEGDIVLLQNEISNVGYAVEQAKKAGAKIALNPSPINENLKTIPMDLIDYFILNEIEGKEISGAESEEPETIMGKLKEKYPKAAFVLTLGEKGSWYFDETRCFKQEIYKVKAVDTTAAGDTFCGYFLSGLTKGKEIPEILKTASAASASAVSRSGAAPSIPTYEEVEKFMAERS